VAAARFWTLHWLGARAAEAEVEFQVTAPIVGYHSGPKGFLADLELLRLKADNSGGRVVFEHPAMALQPVDKELLGAISQAAERGPQVSCWRIRLDPRDVGSGNATDGEAAGWLPLHGASLGAAAAIAFTALEQQWLYDQSCIITGCVSEPGDRIERVSHEREKLNRAEESGRFRLALVAENSGLSDEELAAYEGRSNGRFRVQRVATVEQAIRAVSLLVTGYRSYLEAVIGAPDRGPLPAYMGNRKRSELYIEPDVLKWEWYVERFEVG